MLLIQPTTSPIEYTKTNLEYTSIPLEHQQDSSTLLLVKVVTLGNIHLQNIRQPEAETCLQFGQQGSWLCSFKNYNYES